jgi:hypothetical protein
MGHEVICYKSPKVFGKKCLGHGISRSVNTAVILAVDLPPCTSAIDPKPTIRHPGGMCSKTSSIHRTHIYTYASKAQPRSRSPSIQYSCGGKRAAETQSACLPQRLFPANSVLPLSLPVGLIINAVSCQELLLE